MTRHHLAGVAAIALALGMTAAGAQNVEPRRDTDQGKQIDQVERNQQPQTSGQSQEHSNQDNQQGAQNEPGERQPNAPATSGQPRPSTQGRQGGDTQQAAGNEQPDRSGLIALDEQEQTRISDIIRRQRIQPLTNVNFSLSVASTVPSSVRLSRISGELADIFPHYRDFSFFVAKQELVIVDPQSYGIVAFVPISSGGTSATVGTAAPRENSGDAETAAPRPPAKKKAAAPIPNGGTSATIGTAAPREDSGATETAAPPPPAKKKVAPTERKRVTVTEDKPTTTERETTRRSPPRTETDVTVGTSREDKPRTTERETIRRSPRTETDVTVGTSRRDIDAYDEAPPRGRPIGPPVRERAEHDEGPPFPFSLFFGGPH